MNDINPRRQWVFDCADQQIALWDGLDDAIIGMAERCGMPKVVVYDIDMVVRCLSRQMSREDAAEWVSYNILGSFIGDTTPLLFMRFPRPRRRGNAEIKRLRDALAQIAANKDEPYSADFAREILELREDK